jgi:branched-chain amino acid transport system permease protein
MFIELIDVLISGITNGSVYALMAIGMALVYGVSKVFNFAYGSFYSLGGYIAWLLFTSGLNYFFVFIVSIPILFIIGMAAEKYAIRPLRARDDWEMTAVMMTLGLALFLDNFYLVVFGPKVKSIPMLSEDYLSLGEIVFSIQDIIIFISAIFIMAAFIIFLGKNRWGMAIKAVASNMTGAQIVGIPKDKIFNYSFAMSVVLVGISGILLAPKTFISPMGGWGIMLKAWVITALGGMGSIKGSLVAAFVLGIVEAIVAWQFGFTYVWFAWFLILLVTLVIRPQGFFGTWG